MANEPNDKSITAALAKLARLQPTQGGEGDLIALLAGLAPTATARVIEGGYFRDETIRVDGYTFARCRFDRCKLVTDLATFTFRECFIAGDCQLYFVGPALKVARLIMHVLKVKGRITQIDGEEALFATVNKDGTFTLA
jgi:hypothetical protein